MARLMDTRDRFTRHSGDKLLIFTVRPLDEIRTLVEMIHQQVQAASLESDGDRLPHSRIGVATVDRLTDPNAAPAVIDAVVISAEVASTGASDAAGQIPTSPEPAVPVRISSRPEGQMSPLRRRSPNPWRNLSPQQWNVNPRRRSYLRSHPQHLAGSSQPNRLLLMMRICLLGCPPRMKRPTSQSTDSPPTRRWRRRRNHRWPRMTKKRPLTLRNLLREKRSPRQRLPCRFPRPTERGGSGSRAPASMYQAWWRARRSSWYTGIDAAGG